MALAVLAGTVVGLAQVFLYTARATLVGRRLTVATVLAAHKLEQLRGLTWSYDETGVPVADMQTDISVEPERPTGGRGLAASGIGTLDVNAPGYCDFLDEDGRGLGGGGTPPDGTRFIRRWSVQPLSSNPADTLVLRVRLLSRATGERGSSNRTVVTLATIRTRTMW